MEADETLLVNCFVSGLNAVISCTVLSVLLLNVTICLFSETELLWNAQEPVGESDLASSSLFSDWTASGCIDDIHRYRLLRRPCQSKKQALGPTTGFSDTLLVSFFPYLDVFSAMLR